MSLGSRMRECRIEQGMSLRQLGEKLNVSESTVQRYEKGIIKKLPEETINGIAAALGVSASYLLGEQETIRPEDKTRPVNLTNSEQVLVACYRRLGAVRRLIDRVNAARQGTSRPPMPQATYHDLRHTHAAMLIRMGVQPKVIQERLGHSSIKMTMDLYGYLMPGLQESVADALDADFQMAASGRKSGRADAEIPAVSG